MMKLLGQRVDAHESACREDSRSATSQMRNAVPFAPPLRALDGGVRTKWMCRLCKKYLSSKRSYEEHMNIHNRRRPFACDECEYAAGTHILVELHQFPHFSQSDDAKKTQAAQPHTTSGVGLPVSSLHGSVHGTCQLSAARPVWCPCMRRSKLCHLALDISGSLPPSVARTAAANSLQSHRSIFAIIFLSTPSSLRRENRSACAE